ncbi:MAG TPA: TolC family protein [Puia sp.]
MKKGLLLLLLPVLSLTGHTQDKWDLRRCVEYAVANNISVKQSDVQARLSALTLQQSKLTQLPTLGFSGSTGYSAGRNQDPTTYSLTTQGYVFNQYSLQTSISFFNFNSLRYNAQGNKYALEAANSVTDKLRNDVSLNVANAYLQFLLSYQTSKTAELQMNQSQTQLEITRKQVSAGTLPELNAAELESQVAQDSSAYVTALSNVQQAVLNLKAYMSMDAAVPFALDTPSVDKIPIESLVELQPEMVFSLALANQPQQKADAFQLQAGRKFADANKAAMYPTFSLFGSLGTSYTNQTVNVAGVNTGPPSSQPVGTVTVGATDYKVYSTSPTFNYIYNKPTYFDQLNQNFRQQVGVQVNVPILSGGALKINYRRAQANLRNYELQQQLDNLTLKQNIYQAYNLAVAALQKFEANKKTVAATQRSYDYAQKRYKVGMLNTIDLLTNQNNYYKAKNDLLYSQFDFVFKMKVLEFYKGMGIKL